MSLVLKTKRFARMARREGITDDDLLAAIRRAERGLIDADLGGGLIKQRVPRQGQGRSGGFRTIIAFKRGDRSVFLYCFAKSELANLDDDELSALQDLGQDLLSAPRQNLNVALASGELLEIDDGKGD